MSLSTGSCAISGYFIDGRWCQDSFGPCLFLLALASTYEHESRVSWCVWRGNEAESWTRLVLRAFVWKLDGDIGPFKRCELSLEQWADWGGAEGYIVIIFLEIKLLCCLSCAHSFHINAVTPRLSVCCVSGVSSPRSHRWEEGERLMVFTRFMVILWAASLLRRKLPCACVHVCLSTRTFCARAWWWRRDRSAAVDVMVTGCQVLYSLALIVILYLMKQDYFKSFHAFLWFLLIFI